MLADSCALVQAALKDRALQRPARAACGPSFQGQEGLHQLLEAIMVSDRTYLMLACEQPQLPHWGLAGSHQQSCLRPQPRLQFAR